MNLTKSECHRIRMALAVISGKAGGIAAFDNSNRVDRQAALVIEAMADAILEELRQKEHDHDMASWQGVESCVKS